MDVTAWLLRWAAPRPLVLTAPDGTAARVAVERLLHERGWRPAMSPAEANILVVAGTDQSFEPYLRQIWPTVPAPRAMARVPTPAAAVPALDTALRLLHDAAHQRAEAQALHKGHDKPASHDGHTDTDVPSPHDEHNQPGEPGTHHEHSEHTDDGEPGPHRESGKPGRASNHHGHGEPDNHHESGKPSGSGNHHGHDEPNNHHESVEPGGANNHRGHGEPGDHHRHDEPDRPDHHRESAEPSGSGQDAGGGEDSGHNGHSGHSGHDGHSGHGGHDHHMAGMELPGGIPMADRAADRDGLMLDQLHVPLGPALPLWPAGLIVHTRLQGDIIQQASVEVLVADHAPFWPTRPPLARGLDSAARLLALAGWDDAASVADRLRDVVLDGGDVRHPVERWRRRVRRSRTLRWLLAGVGVVADGPERFVGDALDRLYRLLDDAEHETAAATQWTVDALPGLLAGAELATARLVVASLDPDVDLLTAVRHG